ncbi:hypothetical protein VTI74DRAFT_6911 [Chaetomium olivicolor]
MDIKNTILINGQFPGPLIEANWHLKVKNDIGDPIDGTAIHWHGFLQKNSPWMDGLPGITQCPIAPGKTFTYTFVADSYGTTKRTTNPCPDIGPILRTDYYHRYHFNVMAIPAVNTLINDSNNFNCSLKVPGDNTPCKSNARFAKFKFQRGRKHLLRVVNTGASVLQMFSVDGHNMTVIANDSVPVMPYRAQYVIVETGTNENVPFFIRSQSPDRPCTNTIQPNVSAIAYLDDANVSPTPNPWPSFTASIQNCENAPLEKTEPLHPPDSELANFDPGIYLAMLLLFHDLIIHSI